MGVCELVRGEGVFVKIKIVKAREQRVPVHVEKPQWRQFVHY